MNKDIHLLGPWVWLGWAWSGQSPRAGLSPQQLKSLTVTTVVWTHFIIS